MLETVKKNSPYSINVEEGKSYYWCSCGKSANQPFCDGSHKGSEFVPLKFEANTSKAVFFCGCKETENAPLCDGSHKNITLINRNAPLSKAQIEPDNREIEIPKEETILTASLRNDISHLSACGGIGKCSTCRIEVLEGLEFCCKKTDLEEKLAQRLHLPDNIRLACQTKVSGNIRYRRLLLDKRDLTLSSQLATQKLESVGTIRNLSIMFCDIKGFTPFSEALSAYDVIFILNRYFSIMREVIIQNGGEINNYIGDAILAIFGLKESRQQTLRATNAGLEMLKAMDEFKDYLKKAYGRSFDIRIGIHYGEVIVGSVGYGEDKKLTVIGDTVNIASRIEAINKDSDTRILISDSAFKEIENFVDVRNFLRLKLRGSSKLITLHEVSEIKKDAMLEYTSVKEKFIEGKKWVRTLPKEELLPGEKKKFEFSDKEILLINQEGVFAIENYCPHMNLPLDVGQITDVGTILCPYHNSEFCFKSGEVKRWVGAPPTKVNEKCEPLKIVPTKEFESYIWVQKD